MSKSKYGKKPTQRGQAFAIPAHVGSVAIPSPAVRAYFDTTIVSGLAKHDIGAEEEEATERILAAQSPGVLEIYASALVLEELEKIRPEYRAAHLTQLSGLQSLPVQPVIQATPPFRPTDGPHGRRTSPLLVRLLDVLDRVDAEHIFQVSQHGLRHFITVDCSTILDRAADIENVYGVRVLKPVDFETLLHSRGIATGVGS
jgi:hypothetical protein